MRADFFRFAPDIVPVPDQDLLDRIAVPRDRHSAAHGTHRHPGSWLVAPVVADPHHQGHHIGQRAQADR